MDIPNMLLVGSTARNTGKTTFCLAFLEKWKDKFDAIGLKVTTIREGKGMCHHGNNGCGVCTSFSGNYEIIEEKDRSGEKDTRKLLAAGAKRVFWIRALDEYVQEATNAFMAEIPPEHIVVCESNALSDFVKPGASVLMHRAGIESIKPSAELFMKKADFICDISQAENIEAVLDKIELSCVEGRVIVTRNGRHRGLSSLPIHGSI